MTDMKDVPASVLLAILITEGEGSMEPAELVELLEAYGVAKPVVKERPGRETLTAEAAEPEPIP